MVQVLKIHLNAKGITRTHDLLQRAGQQWNNKVISLKGWSIPNKQL